VLDSESGSTSTLIVQDNKRQWRGKNERSSNTFGVGKRRRRELVIAAGAGVDRIGVCGRCGNQHQRSANNARQRLSKVIDTSFASPDL
jgi:hypothetical protein